MGPNKTATFVPGARDQNIQSAMFDAIDRRHTSLMILSSSHPVSPESSEAARMLTLESDSS
jgi:hypothetical protein